MERYAATSPPPLTNSMQMQTRACEGEGGNSKASRTPSKKSIAFECFGLSRVRCAGSVRNVMAQASKGIAV